MNLDTLIEELKSVRSVDAELVTVHFCAANKHLWIVRVRESKGTYIVWTWNAVIPGLHHGVYECNEQESWHHFNEKVKLYN